jgi:hypothetical protein
MASMKRPRLASVSALPGFTLSLSFIDGSRYTVSLADDVVTLPGLKPLQDGDAFAGVVLADNGWAVEWPALDIQIGADTLWLDAQAQSSKDPATREFLAWRSRNGLSLSSAATAIGLTPRTVSAYGTGKRPVPRYIVLACKGWEAEHRQR